MHWSSLFEIFKMLWRFPTNKMSKQFMNRSKLIDESSNFQIISIPRKLKFFYKKYIIVSHVVIKYVLRFKYRHWHKSLHIVIAHRFSPPLFLVMQIRKKNIHNRFIRSFSQKQKMCSHIFSISRHEKWKLFPSFSDIFSLTLSIRITHIIYFSWIWTITIIRFSLSS